MSKELDWGGNPTPLKVMDLTLRDGTQSLFATRMRTEDMMPLAEEMDEVGFWAMEVWGGATFDAMRRFLNEDPWERPKILQDPHPKNPLRHAASRAEPGGLPQLRRTTWRGPSWISPARRGSTSFASLMR